jgi:NitT/TauT family transport system substrate-binding protein
MIPALATDELSTSVGANSPALFSALARKIGLRIVVDGATFGLTEAAQNLMLRKDLADSGQIPDYPDLRQTAMAVVPGVGVANIMADTALKRGGLTPDDVRIVPLTLPDMAAALTNRSVHTAIVTEPFLTQVAERGLATRWRSAADLLPDHTVTVWMYAEPFAVQRTEAARRFMVALVRGARAYADATEKNVGREEMIAALMKHSQVKDRTLYDKMTFVRLRTATGEVNRESLAYDLEWYRRNGYFKMELDPNEVVDMQFVNYALQRLGPYR